MAGPDGNPVVMLVDDDQAFRDAVSLLVRSVRLHCRDYGSPLAFLDEFDPNVHGCVILDIRMAELGGMAVQEELDRRGSKTPVIFLTGHGDVGLAVRAMRNGAFDFLEKPFHDEALVDSLHAALAYDARQRETGEFRADARRRRDRLTQREAQIASMVARGFTSREIASELALSARTVEGYRSKIMAKLDVDSLADLVRLMAL
jgi:two-component system response regulator FixJ